jgi:hypothetical protein
MVQRSVSGFSEIKVPCSSSSSFLTMRVYRRMWDVYPPPNVCLLSASKQQEYNCNLVRTVPCPWWIYPCCQWVRAPFLTNYSTNMSSQVYVAKAWVVGLRPVVWLMQTTFLASIWRRSWNLPRSSHCRCLWTRWQLLGTSSLLYSSAHSFNNPALDSGGRTRWSISWLSSVSTLVSSPAFVLWCPSFP